MRREKSCCHMLDGIGVALGHEDHLRPAAEHNGGDKGGSSPRGSKDKMQLINGAFFPPCQVVHVPKLHNLIKSETGKVSVLCNIALENMVQALIPGSWLSTNHEKDDDAFIVHLYIARARLTHQSLMLAVVSVSFITAKSLC